MIIAFFIIFSNVIYKKNRKNKQHNKNLHRITTSTTFKDNCRNHKASFNNKQKRYSTELSNYLWQLKDKDKNYTLNWEILCRTKTKPNNNKTCKLCSLEKYEIEKTEKAISLNKRQERQQPCLHNQKIYFKKIKTTF